MHCENRPVEATRPVTLAFWQGRCLLAERSKWSVFFLHLLDACTRGSGHLVARGIQWFADRCRSSFGAGVTPATLGLAWNSAGIGLAWKLRHVNETRHPIGTNATLERT